MMKILMTAAAFGMTLLAVTNFSSAAGRDHHWVIERTQQVEQKLQEAKSISMSQEVVSDAVGQADR